MVRPDRWICRRPCPSRRSDPSPRQGGASRPSRARPMKPEVILHSFGYLTQAAGVTIAVSLAGIALGFVDRRAGLRGARFAPRPGSGGSAAPTSASFAACRCWCCCCSSTISSPNSGSTCRRSSRRSAGSALSSGAYQAEILRGALNAVPRGQTGSGGRARLRADRDLAARAPAAGAAHLDSAAHQRIHPAAQGLVARLGRRHRRTDPGQHEHRLDDLPAARSLCRRRPLLSRDQSRAGGLRRARRAAARGGRARDEPRRPSGATCPR